MYIIPLKTAMRMAHETLGMALNNQPVVDDWQARAEAAETRVTELEAALKPFAETSKCFDTMPVKDPEQWFAYSGTQHANYTVGAITVGDLRRAAKALAPTGKE